MFKVGDDVIYNNGDITYQTKVEEILVAISPDYVKIRDPIGRLWASHVKHLTLVKHNNWLISHEL